MSANLPWTELKPLIDSADYVGILAHYEAHPFALPDYRELSVDDVNRLSINCAQILDTPANMQHALRLAIRANNSILVQGLLQHCLDNNINYYLLSNQYPDNAEMRRLLFRFPLPYLNLAAWYDVQLRPLLLAEIQASLAEDQDASNAQWWVLHLEQLVNAELNTRIPPQEIARIIQSAGVQQQIRAGKICSEFLIPRTQDPIILTALLTTPKIFQLTLNKFVQGAVKAYQHALQPLQAAITTKMQTLASASEQDLTDFYWPLFNYFLHCKNNQSEHLQRMLEHPALASKIPSFLMIKN